MASNFRILTRRHKDGLHLSLKGDFDGSSAHELILALQAHWHKAPRIIIHTDHLKTIHEFGLHIWSNHIKSLRDSHKRIWITGKYAPALLRGRGELWSTGPDSKCLSL